MQKLLIITGLLGLIFCIGAFIVHLYYGNFLEPVEALKTIIGGF